MPIIRMMNWNIEQLSWAKAQIAGMATAIAEVVASNNIDILSIIEVKKVQAPAIMTAVTAAINAHAAAGGVYYWILSMGTGGEHYGFVIRNMAVIRPLAFTANAAAPAPLPDGTSNHPITDLHAVNWTTWPVTFPNAAPAPLPAKPRFALVDAFATPTHARTAKRVNFGGQRLGAGGYSLGRGYRMPGLAMFIVQGAARTLLPIIVCHYAAVRGGRNFLGQQQVAQLNLLHLPQLFSFYDVLAAPPAAPELGYIAVDGVPMAVANVLYTGDYNVDFLQNLAGGTFLQTTNHNALLSLTPTQQSGGSAAPAAAAGAVPPPPLPAVPFAAFPGAPIVSDIPAQTLRAAVTQQGTILVHYNPAVAPANTAALRGAAFDNIFYGGAAPNSAAATIGAPPQDSGNVIDIPAAIAQPGGGGGPSVVGPLAHYTLKNTKNAAAAPNLGGAFGVAPALSVNDRLIGARLISDHVPVIMQFNCP